MNGESIQEASLRERSTPDENWSEVVNPAMVLRYTRQWLHYGTICFVVVCSIVAAVRGLAGQ